MRNIACVVFGMVLSAGLFLGRGYVTSVRAADDAPATVPAAGTLCRVYLRGDAAGTAYHDRIADVGNLIVRHGTFQSSDANWIVLKDGEKQLWVPRSSIMLMEVGK
jgi:hypothetical protein